MSDEVTTEKLACRHDVGRAVNVHLGRQRLLTYVYRPDDAQRESPRPYFHPMYTLGGELVTVFRPHDHVWHKGLAWSLPHLGHDNFWGGRTFAAGEGYVQRDNNGSMDHETLLGLDITPEQVRYRHALGWHTQAGARVVEEVRTLTTSVTADRRAWVQVFDTAMTNTSGATIPIGSPTTAGRDNAGYGGLFWRGPRSFTGGKILAPQAIGGDELRGQKAPWMGFTGRHDERSVSSTLLIVDDADNPRHPPQWFVRSEGFAGVCPAPFFSDELMFEPGATLRLRYAVVIADGLGDADVAETLAAHGRRALERAAA